MHEAHGVARHASPWCRSILGADDDEAGVDAKLKVGDGGGEEPLGGSEVDLHGPIPLLGLDLLNGCRLRKDSSVEDKDVHTTKAEDKNNVREQRRDLAREGGTKN